MTFENYVKAIENLGTMKAEISAVKEKLNELETEETAISAVTGEMNLEKDQKKMQLIEATLKVLDSEESKASLTKELETIQNRIKDFERLDSISNEKIDLEKKLNQLIKKLKTGLKKYNSEKNLFETEIATLGVEICDKKVAAKETPIENQATELEEEVETKSDSITALPDEIVPVVETKTVEEKAKENTVHPLQVLCEIMKNFDEVYQYNVSPSTDNSYSVAFASSWEEVILPEKVFYISDICDEKEIPGMTPSQVRKLKFSLPTELLGLIGREDVIDERRKKTSVYKENGRNTWRSKFTYQIISELWDMVNEKINATEEKSADIEADIEEFMIANTDHIESTGIFKLEKAVWEAFAVVEA